MDAADTLYGVSMGGDGISRVISRKLAGRLRGARSRPPKRRLSRSHASTGRPCARPMAAGHPALAYPARADGPHLAQKLFDTGDDAPPAPDAEAEAEPERRGFFRRLRDNMSMTRAALGAELQATVFQTLDDETFERLEEALIYADVGAPTTAAIVEKLEHEAETGELSGREDLSRRLRELLADTARVGGDTIPAQRAPGRDPRGGRERERQDDDDREDRLAPAEGARTKVLIAAGDTFRAAAAEQLTTWADRAGCDIVRGEPGSDPERRDVRRDRGRAGTRGRRGDLRHGGRLHPAAPDGRAAQGPQGDLLPGSRRAHETLLTIDATTGQNGLRQALLFREAVDVTGIALTKLDGTAKGGIALAIAQELAVPVKLIGVGEALEDLRPFDADDFARAILEP